MAPKPYDKSPEWETLTGHSDEIRTCCIGNRESGHPLIATASDDSTVQLWDTRNMPSPRVVKLPNHNSPVQECTFSNDNRLAVSCSLTETWVWQAQSPVHRLHRLHPASGNGASGTCPCFSEDTSFVSVFVETGVDVWHLKSGVDPHGSDRSLLMGAHRTLTFLTVRHLFTKFTSDGLYTCLFTESEPETVRLYLAINKYSLEKWEKHELKDPPPKDLNEREAFEQRFSVDSGNQITEAAISNTCGRLVAISVPRQSNSQDWMKGPAEVHLWDLNNHTNWKVQISLHPTIIRRVKVGCEYLVTFVQCRNDVTASHKVRSDRTKRRSSYSVSSVADEGIFHVIDREGLTVQTFQIPGQFSGLSVVNGESCLRKISEELLTYSLQEGVVKVQEVRSNKVMGTFTVNNTEITAVNISSKGKSAVVGCANGNVHIIEMI